jgi:hypothetical protein
MPPHTSFAALSPRVLYLFTTLAVASVVVWTGLAGAGQPEAQCKGNSPKKVCPAVLPADGATVSGIVTVSAQVDEPVTSVTFEVDNVVLAPPDTAAPYEARWDTTRSSNGAHVLAVTALDTSGQSATRENRVSVSNAAPPPPPPPPPPGDTTAPTVALTSPAAGATVSGSVSIAASASDNVAVVGVQFKLDGANVGSEDTTAPYSVAWNTAAVTNGSHTVTAVARDAAGNSASSQRSVTVSNSAPPPSGSSLTWAPPVLSNPATITVTNANRRLYLDNSRDYRLNITEHLKRELWIEGGRNVVVIGGHITIDALGSASSYQDNTALKVRFGDPSGTVHIEGLLIDGPYVADGIGIATGRNVQLQNVRVDRAYNNIKGAHADCVQIQQGVGHLRMDRFTCSTDLQGIFLGDHSGAIRSADLRRVNIYGVPGKHMFFQTNPTYPVALSEVWLAIASGYTAWASFGYLVYPQEDGRTWDGLINLNRRSQVSSDGTYLTFVGSQNTISGRINKGVPSGGDFVTRSSAGTGYVSPGY